MLGFDAELNVSGVEGADAATSGRVLGRPLTVVLGVADAVGLRRSAQEALGGSQLTVCYRDAHGPGGVIVRLGPDAAAPGFGIAVAVERAHGGNGQGERVEEFEQISAVARELARGTHPEEVRATICEVALSVCSADRAVLFEPDPSQSLLRATACAGVHATGAELPLDEGSAPAIAYRTNSQSFVADPAGESVSIRSSLELFGVASAIWQPLARGRSVRGLLLLGWPWQLTAMAERSTRLLEVVSIEAAVALDRGSAFGRLIALAGTDSLTGLPNRRAWEEGLSREMARAARENTPLAVAMIDLDGFKAYNDSRGHPAGDLLLGQISREWRQSVRASDSLARYGGDEFAITFPNCDPANAARMLDRLRAESSSESTFSAGLVIWDASETREALIGRADAALYEAKAEGHARTCFA